VKVVVETGAALAGRVFIWGEGWMASETEGRGRIPSDVGGGSWGVEILRLRLVFALRHAKTNPRSG
jgi:hypothetical protein